MNTKTSNKKTGFWIRTMLICAVSSVCQADIIMDWNVVARNLVVEAKLPTPPANRVMAIVHTAMYESIKETSEAPAFGDSSVTDQAAALEATVASASHISLLNLIPKQKQQINAAYLKALSKIENGSAKDIGIEIGAQAAKTVLAARMQDGHDRLESYRPLTSAGHYVPTTIPAVPQWPQRQPWLLTSATQFRPGPPPELASAQWAKDLNEVKEIGAKNSSIRSAEQTEIAQFWEATLPPIYHGVVHSVAAQADRSVLQNARLFALVTQATDDAMIAVFDAKYHYGLWRPITAIRNADIDSNEHTERDPSWTPFIPTPMHPEYPCAHCVVAGTVGAILKAEVGDGEMPLLTTRSDTAENKQRSWDSVDAFVAEVNNARIYDGVHYRTSSEVGSEMGKKIGNLAITSWQQKQ